MRDQPRTSSSRAAESRPHADDRETVLALDIGGTKIAAALVDADGHVQPAGRVATPREGGDALTRRVLDLAETAAAVRPPVGVGVSVAGAVASDDSTVTFAPNLPGWDGLPLGELLADRLGVPARVTYDGHAGALGEYRYGAGRGSRGMAFVIIGTGVGGGLVFDGRLHRGVHGLAGAAGWMAVDAATAETPSAPERGALEAVASGPSLVAAAHRAGLADVRVPHDLVELAARGSKSAGTVIDHAVRCVARAVVSMVSLLDLDTVVLGGGVGTGVPDFVTGARTAVAALAQPAARPDARVVVAARGDDAFLVGAAARLLSESPA
ncbi:MAG: ROK family protein [Streptosporangiales bacterium]